ncbi:MULTISPECIES: ATP-binding protein [unclassified Streptomyces]|uniref:ATP-binding protein n=1 Tax=Streptomyces flavovirens TaxID=52258 RepID=A0ABV8N5J6_9ACTN|nr:MULTISPECIES: ATP-binding protein [unclassified Streptomyces]MBK3594018.1 ATP-binding protein [Streptomyces sp. MBT51]
MTKRQKGPSVQLHRRLGHTDLPAVGEARCALREFLRHRSDPEETDTAELLLSELVTNALIHTRNGAAITVTSAPGRLRVEVRDFVAGQEPAPYVPNADDGTHGRGLLLVQSLADSWGVMTQALGKVVWFELTAGKPA